MHMADALLSPAVGLTMCALSTGALAYSTTQIKKDELSEKKLPLMAVAGAFVFAAQMINFTIPGTGSSGHIGGGILLAALLGGYPALLTIAGVLIIQCLFFADGGLLALGCNIFNMGVIPCLLIYPLLFKPLTRTLTPGRITAASILCVMTALELGAFGVVLETLLSGVTALPFPAFTAMMLPIHLAIGLAEGLVTAAVLCFVYAQRPEILQSARLQSGITAGVSLKRVLLTLGVLTLVMAGGLSLAASAYPDGLEWSMEKVTGTAELTATGPVYEGAAAIQQSTALMPDYADSTGGGTALAGLLGAGLTFGLAACTGLLIAARKKKRTV